MRYTGGLLGGTWLTSLMGDLGNGTFDGAHLVQNFESLDPANTLWGKPYNLYSKVDTEEPRYLGFEKWWSGYFFTTKEEMRGITDELFVGNKLTKGTIQTSDRRAHRPQEHPRADRGDRVLGRQHHAAAAGAQLDPRPVRERRRDPGLRADDRLHARPADRPSRHLRLGQGRREAARRDRQHARPDRQPAARPLRDGHRGQAARGRSASSSCRATIWCASRSARSRTFWRSATGARTRQAFETVARVSEINEGLYDTFVSPWVKLCANDATAEALRMMHPLRLERFTFSDMNPMLWPLQAMAQAVREQRRPVAADNPSSRRSRRSARQIEKSLDLYRNMRERNQELLFKAIYNSPLVEALAGLRAPYADARKPRAPRRARRAAARGQDRGDQGARGAGWLCRGCAAHRARRRLRPSRWSMRAASGSPSGSSRSTRCCARYPARTDKGRRQGGGVHAALRPGARARCSAADAAERGGAPRGRGDRAPDRLRGWRDHAGERDHARRRSSAFWSSIVRRSRSRSSAPLAAARPPRPPSSASRAQLMDRRTAAADDGRCRTASIGTQLACRMGEQDEEVPGSGRDRAAAKAPREYRVYPALIERCAELEPVTTAVAHPCDESSLTAAVEAAEAALIRPILVGPEARSGPSPSSSGWTSGPTGWSTRRTATPPPPKRSSSSAPARPRP